MAGKEKKKQHPEANHVRSFVLDTQHCTSTAHNSLRDTNFSFFYKKWQVKSYLEVKIRFNLETVRHQRDVEDAIKLKLRSLKLGEQSNCSTVGPK